MTSRNNALPKNGTSATSGQNIPSDKKEMAV
jgi:hypothetical protein